MKKKTQIMAPQKYIANAKLPTSDSTPIVKKCGCSNCGTYDNFMEGKLIQEKKHVFIVKKYSTCSTLMHIIICSASREDYTGVTILTL